LTNAQTSPRSLSTEAGASVYSPLVLKLYDWWVLGLSNRFAWKCPTKTVLLPFFKEHIRRRHLDVGVGTGFYLAHAGKSSFDAITLLDLNDNSLRAAAARLKQPSVRILKQDVTRPLSLPPETRFDSISLFYLLHCLPGGMEDKEVAFANLKRYLSRDGVIFGATILGDEANHNPLGRLLMKTYNRKGLFSNRADTIDRLQGILKNQFQSVQVWQHNRVALFVARAPINAG
jgi:SAM-dependent methyltransferase